jgi:hypothetical protein
MPSYRSLTGAAGAALWLLAAASGSPSAAAPPPPTPKLVFERVEFDAGKVAPGDVIRVDFPLRNEGRAPLNVLDVKEDCGCLVPSYDEGIDPGEAGRVRVALRTSGFQGPIEKHVYVETDDPKQPAVALTIKAVLPRAVEAAPSSEILILVTPGKPASAEVTLRSTDTELLNIHGLESGSPFVTAEVAPGSAASGPEVRLRLTVAADAPSDTFETLVTVNTGHPRMPRLGLKLFGQPAVSIAIRPPRLAFGRVRPKEKGPVERILTLSRASGSFRVLKADDSLGLLRLEVAEGSTPFSCEIKVTYSGGWTEEQTQGILRITTDDPSRPLIEVPYTAAVW